MYTISYISAKSMPLLDKGLVDFLTKSRKKSAISRTLETIKPMLAKGAVCGNWNDVCRAGGYLVLAYLDNKKVNPSLLQGFESVIDNWEFPYHSVLGLKEGKLHFCIIHETCSPNWNHEAVVVKEMPLADIKVAVVADESGIKRMDKTLYKFLANEKSGLNKVDFPDFGTQPSKEELKELIAMGMPCYYRHGWAYRGAGRRPITAEKALELLPSYSYGKGFYMLDFTKEEGIPTLEFNELSELDME